MKNLIKAVLNVMLDVESIDKNMTVGSGNSSYKGVADKDVKHTIGVAMRKNGLIILPTGIEKSTQIDRWEEESQYGKKMKQNVLTEVITKYTLFHESGESVELFGYGHGVDPQDKAAGKATTYALKYTLLYSFLVATGQIDDADTTHSNNIQTPQPTKPQLTATTAQSEAAKGTTVEQLKARYTVTAEQESKYKQLLNK
jgi:hypothetical protein